MDKGLRKTIMILVAVPFFVFALSFALIPIYNSLCRNTGWSGKVFLTKDINPHQRAILSRQLTMQFLANNNEELPWDFYPQQTSLDIHPEENNKVFFVVKNNTKHAMTVQAVPSVTPWQATPHLHKIECFCFTQQTLAAGETKKMPLIFRIDKDVPKEIQTITLSYTLFDVTPEKKGVS